MHAQLRLAALQGRVHALRRVLARIASAQSGPYAWWAHGALQADDAAAGGRPRYDLVRVSPELIAELAGRPSPPVVLLEVKRQQDGTLELILREPDQEATA